MKRKEEGLKLRGLAATQMRFLDGGGGADDTMFLDGGGGADDKRFLHGDGDGFAEEWRRQGR